MTAPPKPWERTGVNSQSPTTNFNNEMSGTLPPTALGGISGAVTPSASAAPPQVPARPSAQGTYGSSGLGGYSGLGSYGGYSGYGGGMYGSGMYGTGGMYGGGMYGGGMYGGYGGGYGMNRLGYGDQGYNPNGFVQQAEENARQTFQSIESVVNTFGSVSMMMESSFYAVHNSFRAVIGVADQFGRMKTHFTQIFGALAIFRLIKWLFRKFLVLLRLREAGLPEDVWAQAAEASGNAILDAEGKKPNNWPLMLFFAIIIGGPWLIWKLLQSLGGNSTKEWANGNDDHFVVQAQYDFIGQGENELSFRRGQRINVAPKEMQPRMRGWLLASVDGNKVGIIPANYIKILGKRSGKKQVGNQVVPSREGVASQECDIRPAGIQQPQVDFENEFGKSEQRQTLPSVNSLQNLENMKSPFEEDFSREQNLQSMDNTTNKSPQEILNDDST